MVVHLAVYQAAIPALERSTPSVLKISNKLQARIFVEVQLDLFSKISQGANTEEKLSIALGISALNAERITIACLGLGLIIRDNNNLKNAPDVERFLIKGRATYAGEWMFVPYNASDGDAEIEVKELTGINKIEYAMFKTAWTLPAAES